MAAKTTRRSSGTIHFDSEVTFAGNTATISSTDLSIGDSLLTLNKGNASLPTSSGIEIEEAGSIISGVRYTEDVGNNNGTWTFLGKGSAKVDFNNATFENYGLGAVASLDLNGGTIDSTTIGAITPSTGVFTDLTASGTVNLGTGLVSATTFTGALTGDVTGDLTGDVTGDVTGNVTGNLIGDVYASDTVTKVFDPGTNGTDATLTATLTGDSTGVHTGNVKNGSGTVIVDVTSSPAMVTGQVDSIANHSTTNLSEGTNLYYTNTRADARIGLASIDDLADVDTTGVLSNNILQWNGTNFVPATIGYSVANWQTSTHTGTTTLSGATIDHSQGGEAASGLSSSVTIIDPGAKIRVEAHLRYNVQHTAGSYTKFYARLYRNKGGSPEALISEQQTHRILSTDGTVTVTSNFDVFDTPGVAQVHTYSVYFSASDANGQIDPNPAFTTGTGTPTNFIQVTEVIINNSIIQNIVEDASPQLGGALDAQTFQINNLGAPSLGTDAATKTYVDTEIATGVATANELSELTDVDTSGITNNAILKYNGSSWIIATDIDTTTDLIDDASPQLGGALDVNGNDIISTTNADIDITPDGTGKVQLKKDTAITGSLTISENLVVSGDTTTIDVAQLEVEDSLIYLNRGSATPNTFDSGILIERGGDDHAGLIWQETSDQFVFLTSNAITSSTNIVSNVALADVQANEVQATTVLTPELTTGAPATAGTIEGTWTLTAGSTLGSTYSDLAEKYTSDIEYQPGTIVVHGGTAEVTQSTTKMDHKVAGVVSSNPAYIMNSDETGLTVSIALSGKVPTSVIGPVAKGDLIVTSDTPGVGEAHPGVTNCVFVIGKAIEDDDTENLVRLINILV
jgi:hypothetical protein